MVVRLVNNNLPYETAIHWHGLDVANHSDGSPLTQNARPNGGTYLYKLHFARPGLYWYHPHHHASTNQVFRGLYGPIVVPDPVEALLPAGTLPGPADTQVLVLSDMTVCKAPMSNDAHTYSSMQPWVGNPGGGPPLPDQGDANPVWLCELPNAIDDDGNAAVSSYAANDVPSIQVMMGMPGIKTNEGQTVLTNGMNVGGRGGTPDMPAAALDPGAFSRDVNSGQNIRLQIFNAATVRYFRLRLTTHLGAPVQLFRIGGEGGLLNNPILEGGTTGSGFVTGYDQGEILLPPGSRAEVVAFIPAGLPMNSFLTMWTEDFQRTGTGYSNIPTVPVMHLRVNGVASDTPISAATVLRSGPNVVEVLGPATGHLLDPATFTPPKLGRPAENIQLTATGMHPLIDGVQMMEWMGAYTAAPHIDPMTPPGSSRWAQVGDIVELSVENLSSAHHPIHFHGFPMQPKTLTKSMSPTFTFPDEFRDNIDLPAG
jgi:FtsP/CotA-like multicopper oxidase with cupredoxin domain